VNSNSLRARQSEPGAEAPDGPMLLVLLVVYPLALLLTLAYMLDLRRPRRLRHRRRAHRRGPFRRPT
jgi:hypothetical protein